MGECFSGTEAKIAVAQAGEERMLTMVAAWETHTHTEEPGEQIREDRVSMGGGAGEMYVISSLHSSHVSTARGTTIEDCTSRIRT